MDARKMVESAERNQRPLVSQALRMLTVLLLVCPLLEVIQSSYDGCWPAMVYHVAMTQSIHRLGDSGLGRRH